MKFEEVEINSERWLSLEDLLNEEWKDIEGYEGHYQVSNYGRIKSYKYRQIKILRPTITHNGYAMVVLSLYNVKKYKTIHRLVAENFIENPNNYPCVNHKDCNKLKNLVSNLEWCTIQYNTLHAYKNR